MEAVEKVFQIIGDILNIIKKFFAELFPQEETDPEA